MGLFDLTGRVAVVTGASSGLGADAARGFVESGAKVAMLARRKDKLDVLAQELTAQGGQVLPVCCDVTNEGSVRVAVEEVMAVFGTVDILINNAGIALRGSVDDMTLEEWNRSFEVNVNGVFLMCKYVVPIMKQNRYGRIVNISTVNTEIADKNPPFLRHSYNSSKAAVNGLTKGMAASLAQHGITVNAVGPGLFESEMTEGTLFKSEVFLNSYNAQNPMGRPAHRGELNGPIQFFSSEACSYVTGQYITVDGGHSLV